MEIRMQDHWIVESVIGATGIDVSTYDLAGRLTTDGQATLCGADETPQFMFLESADKDQAVNVAYFGAVSGQAKVALSGTGSKGDKLSVGAGGKIVASGTAQNAEPDEDDIGIALADWTNGDETEVWFIKGSKV